MRRQPVQIAQEDPVGNDEPKILHVAVGLGHGGVVVEHQQNAGDKESDEQKEGDGTKIVGSPDAQRFLAHLYGKPVQEKIAEDGQAARAVGMRGTAAEDGLPDVRVSRRFWSAE